MAEMVVYACKCDADWTVSTVGRLCGDCGVVVQAFIPKSEAERPLRSAKTYEDMWIQSKLKQREAEARYEALEEERDLLLIDLRAVERERDRLGAELEALEGRVGKLVEAAEVLVSGMQTPQWTPESGPQLRLIEALSAFPTSKGKGC